MYEIYYLPTNASATKDWEKLPKKYSKYSAAQGVGTRMMNTGKYDRVVVCLASYDDLVVRQARSCVESRM